MWRPITHSTAGDQCITADALELVSAPYGDTLANENPAALGVYPYNLRFAGQFFDKETNHHYNWHRDYESTSGRYLQSDPIGLAGGVNLYRYASNTPVTRDDVLGLLDWTGWSQSGGLGRFGGGLSGDQYELTSQCIGGTRLRIRIVVGYGEGGVSLLPGNMTWQPVSFRDPYLYLTDRAFRGDALKVTVLSGAAVIGQSVYQSVRIGEASSLDNWWNGQLGIDATLFAVSKGVSKVLSSKQEACDCR